MNKKLLQILRCPNCKSELMLSAKDSTGEILIGSLICANIGCDKRYEIVEGVPHMTDELNPTDDKTQKTFSRQWTYYKYNEAKSWGRTPERRSELFYRFMKLSKQEVKGKTLIDTACGSAELTMLLGSDGYEFVVGMDFSDIVYEAYKNNPHKDKVFIVKGDVLNPPFEKATFDYVHSAGTIMHTSDAKKAFDELSDIAKLRFCVWFYLERHLVKKRYRNWTIAVHHMIRPLPLWAHKIILDWIAYPLVTLAQTLELMRKDTPNERKMLLRDAFTPHETYLNPEEVISWAKDKGYKSFELTDDTQSDGVGYLGIK